MRRAAEQDKVDIWLTQEILLDVAWHVAWDLLNEAWSGMAFEYYNMVFTAVPGGICGSREERGGHGRSSYRGRAEWVHVRQVLQCTSCWIGMHICLCCWDEDHQALNSTATLGVGRIEAAYWNSGRRPTGPGGTMNLAVAAVLPLSRSTIFARRVAVAR